MGFSNWKRFILYVKPTSEIVDEIAMKYANAKLEEAAENLNQTAGQWNSDFNQQKNLILSLKDKI